MTIHVVELDGQHRLYTDDGDRISNMEWETKPDGREITDALDEHHGGASVLANAEARRQFFDVCHGDVVYHGGDSNLPWDGDQS